MTFAERRQIYFPEDSEGLITKVWKNLGAQPGYISKYHSYVRRLGPEGKATLNSCLGEWLSLCQCLPDSFRHQTGGWIWKAEHKKIVVLTNPDFYRIEKIGKEKTQRTKGIIQRSAPAQRGIKSISIQMMVLEKVPIEVAEKAYRYVKDQDRRSAKSKNRRKPPQRKRKRAEVSDDDSEKGTEDEDAEMKEISEDEEENEMVVSDGAEPMIVSEGEGLHWDKEIEQESESEREQSESEDEDGDDKEDFW